MITRDFRIIRRWLWLLVLATVVAAVTTYWIGQQQPTFFETKTRLIVGPGIDSPNPDLNALRAGGKLILTYAELATTQPTLQAALDDLKLDIDPTKIDNKIQVKSDESTQTLTIIVQDEDPVQAIAIANAIARVLVRLSPSNPDGPQAEIKDQMFSQATKLEASIATSETLIKQLETRLQTTADLKEQALIRDQLSQERNRLTDGRRTLALLYDSLQAASVNQVKIIEPAIQAQVVNTDLQLRVWIGAVIGLILGLVIALVFEYFDDTIKTVEGLTEAINIPLLGTIARHRTLWGMGRQGLVVQTLPQSPTTETYRALAAKLVSKCLAGQAASLTPAVGHAPQNLQTLSPDVNVPLRSILVSSIQTEHDPGELAANLATILAQIGRRVILVDVCLSRPTLGRLFGIDESNGLTNILTEHSKGLGLIPIDSTPGLSILPAGPVSSNSFELLASTRMSSLVEELKSQADVVIITTSPLLSSADSFILASRVDGVLVVARTGKTPRNMINRAVESLGSLNAHIIGVVFDYNDSWHLPFLSRWTVKWASMKKAQKQTLANQTGY